MDVRGTPVTGAALSAAVAGVAPAASTEAFEACVAAGVAAARGSRVLSGGAECLPLRSWAAAPVPLGTDLTTVASPADVPEQLQSLAYLPTADDVGCRLQLRAWDAAAPSDNSGFAETSTIGLAGDTRTAVEALLLGDAGVSISGLRLQAHLIARPAGGDSGGWDAEVVPLVGAAARESVADDVLATLAAVSGGGVMVTPDAAIVTDGDAGADTSPPGAVLSASLPSPPAGKSHAAIILHPLKHRVFAIVVRGDGDATVRIVTLAADSPAHRDAVAIAVRRVVGAADNGADAPLDLRAAGLAALRAGDARDAEGFGGGATASGGGGATTADTTMLTAGEDSGAEDGDGSSIVDGDDGSYAGGEEEGVPTSSSPIHHAPDSSHSLGHSVDGTAPRRGSHASFRASPLARGASGSALHLHAEPHTTLPPPRVPSPAPLTAPPPAPAPLPPLPPQLPPVAAAQDTATADGSPRPHMPMATFLAGDASTLAAAGVSGAASRRPSATAMNAPPSAPAPAPAPPPAPSPAPAPPPAAGFDTAMVPASVLVAVQAALTERVSTLAERDHQLAERDRLLAERDRLVAERERALADRDRALMEAARAATERERLVVSLQERVAELSGAVAAARDAGSKASEEAKRGSATAAAQNEELKALRVKVNRATEEADTARAALSSAKGELAEAAKRNDRLNKQLQQVSALLTASKAELDETRAAAAAATARGDAALDDATAKGRAGAAAVAALGEARRSASVAAEEAKRSLDTITAERDRLAVELRESAARCEAATSRAAAADAMAASLSARTAAAEREAGASKLELDDLRTALATAASRSTEREVADAGMRERLEAAAVKANVASVEAEAGRARVTELTRTVETLAREKAAAVTAGEAAAAEVATLRGSVAGLDAKVKKFAAAADSAKALGGEVATLREALDSMTAERNAANRKAESLRRDVARMTGGSEELKSMDIEALARSKKSLEEKVVRLSSENAALLERVETLTSAAAAGAAVVSGSGRHPPATPASAPSLSGFGGGGGGGGRGPASPGTSGGGGSVGRMSFAAAPPPPTPSGGGMFSSMLAPPPTSSGISVGMGGGGGGSEGGESGKVRELQRLANALLEQLSDKEEALAQQRATKEALAARIRELEGTVAVLRAERS